MTWRRRLLFLLAACMALGCSPLLDDGGDSIDTGLAVLQWGLAAVGMGGAGVGVKAFRETRRQGREPSRASGEVTALRQRIDRLEWLLMSRGIALPPETPTHDPP